MSVCDKLVFDRNEVPNMAEAYNIMNEIHGRNPPQPTLKGFTFNYFDHSRMSTIGIVNVLICAECKRLVGTIVADTIRINRKVFSNPQQQ